MQKNKSRLEISEDKKAKHIKKMHILNSNPFVSKILLIRVCTV